MSAITTHVLDTVLGKPAAGIAVRLEKLESGRWTEMGTGVTDQDGRCRTLAEGATEGQYRLTFVTGDYFKQMGRNSIYPEISIVFSCNGEAHYHLPVLLSDNGYTTYRGS